MATIKKYAISSAVTFLSAAGAIVVLNIDALTAEGISRAALTGIVLAAVRAGVKAVAENVFSFKA